MPKHSGVDVSPMEPDVDDKLLFSEDLISYFMGKILWKNTPFSEINVAPISGPYRGKVYNGFNENMKGAVDIIHLLLQDRIRQRFFEIAVQNKISYISFKEFEKDIRTRYFSTSGIDAIRFLKYCVFLAVLSGKFYKYGWKGTPDMAADLIAKAFPDGKMSRVTWEMLNMAAKGYAARNKYVLEQSSTKFSNERLRTIQNVNDSEISVGCFSCEIDREVCSCFKAAEEGRSFKSVFKKRDRLLKYHKIIGLRRINRQMNNVSEMKPRTLKEYMQFLDSLGNSENFTIRNSPGYASGDARTYREKAEDMFASQLDRPPATLEAILDSGHQQILEENEPLYTYRESTQKFYRIENDSQEYEHSSVNYESTFEAGHGQTFYAGSDLTRPRHDGLQEFIGFERAEHEHKPLALSPGYPRRVEHQAMSKLPTINLSRHSFLKAVDDIYNQRVQSGFDDFSVFQKSTESSPAEVPYRYFLPTAAREEIIAHEVEEFFRSRDASFQEANAATVTVNANSIDRNIPSEQIPSIDLKYLTAAFNNSIQIGKEKPLRIGGFQRISREEPITEPIDILRKKWSEDIELQNNFLTASLYTLGNLTERPLRIGEFQSVSRDGPMPVLRRERPEDTELQNNFSQASLYTNNVENRSERPLRIGGFQGISNEESRTSQETESMPDLKKDSPQDPELSNNLKDKLD